MMPHAHSRIRAALLAVLALVALATSTARVVRAAPAPARVRKSPYLAFPGDPTRMTVLWQLTARDTSTLVWGTDTSFALGRCSSAEYGRDHQHAVTLAGLVPGQRYEYRVLAGGAAFDGAFTAAPESSARRVELLACGDTGGDPDAVDRVAAGMRAACAADEALGSLVLFAGDVATFGDNEGRWTAEFFGPALPNLRALMARVPYVVCRGNHDCGEPLLLAKYFPTPWGANRFGSFDYGPVHVAVMDQYVPFDAGSRQLAWLADDLARSPRPWKIVLMHEPAWAANGKHPNVEEVQTDLHPLFRRCGVALVLNGHDHYYARASVDGIAYVTTGGAGSPLFTPQLPAEHVVVAHRAYHWCTIAIDGDRLVLRAQTPEGATLDSLVLTR